ncbi:MAG: hypothetical protein VYE68_06845 [Acidobacteriota bacterium]|nr:hypothetical protein [Acidobacteriota bacterium]
MLSDLRLINIPIGSIVGIYGLWVLLNEETACLLVGGPGVVCSGPPAPLSVGT